MQHGIGVLAFAIIGGYWLLERALTHKGQMKQLGLFLGSLIIIGSLAGIVCQLWSLRSARMGGAWCPYPQKMMPPSPAAR